MDYPSSGLFYNQALFTCEEIMTIVPLTLGTEHVSIGAASFVAANATVLGEVEIEEQASVWFGVVIRGDTAKIHVGACTNVQDGSVLHADPGFPCTIGRDVTIGHKAIVHGATVGDRCLIGMNATVMNGVVLGEESVVGAGALLPEGKSYPPRSLIVGVPGRVIRGLKEEEILGIRASAAHYVHAACQYLAAGYGKPEAQDT